MRITINEIIGELINHIKENSTSSFNPYKDSMNNLFNGKAEISDIVRLLESLFIAEEYIKQKDEFFLMAYDELLAHISEKTINEQKLIVKTIRKHFEKYFIWETTSYHCICRLESRTNIQSNDEEVA